MAEEQKEQKRQGVRRGIKIGLIIFFIAFIVAVVGSLFYLNWIINIPTGDNSEKTYFEVKKDESTVTISEHLQEKNLIKSETIFYLYSKIKGKSLMPGIYEISKNAKMVEVFDKISNGDTKIIKFTVPEGYRIEQIGQLLEEKQIGNYSDFVAAAKQYEGELFPDTYYFSPDKTSDQIIETMHLNYLDKVSGLNITDEDLIIASIVEREADRDAQRPIVAGIYKNRINSGMKMESDPTISYGRDSINIAKSTLSEKLSYMFWKAATTAEFSSVNSSYNTYIAKGLPPGPICNPGLASIEATINSTDSDYLYFIVVNHQIYPAKTFAEHQQNVQKYLISR